MPPSSGPPETRRRDPFTGGIVQRGRPSTPPLIKNGETESVPIGLRITGPSEDDTHHMQRAVPFLPAAEYSRAYAAPRAGMFRGCCAVRATAGRVSAPRRSQRAARGRRRRSRAARNKWRRVRARPGAQGPAAAAPWWPMPCADRKRRGGCVRFAAALVGPALKTVDDGWIGWNGWPALVACDAVASDALLPWAA